MLTPADNYATLYTLIDTDNKDIDVHCLAEAAEGHVDNINNYLGAGAFEDWLDYDDGE